MFGFEMAGNYDSRKVDRFEDGPMFVSTAMVTDSEKPYETAICHPEYNNGKIVIVETYDSRKAAQNGHARWVSKMTASELPETITDASGAFVASLADAFGSENSRIKKRTPTKGTK